MSSIRVTVNGERRELPTGITIGQLVADSGLPENAVAVEVNERLVPRAERANHPVSDGDRVELVTLVGGG